jgi:RND family efflux transporter MFP subunit
MKRGAGAVVIAIAVSLSGCGESESAREAKAMQAATPQRLQPDGSIKLTDADRAALALLTAPAAETELPESTLRFGRVLSPPANEAQVVSSVTGRVTRPPLVELGASVSASAALIEIMPVLDTPDRIAVGTQSAERVGQIEAAEREVSKAEADAARARELSPQVVSVAQLQEAETALATARARLEGLRNARTASDQAQSRPVTVTAPVSGTISAINVEVGGLVNRGDVLARLLRAGPLWIDLFVPPDDPTADRYEVETPSGPIPARLLTGGRLIDPDGTRHDRLIVAATSSTVLRPGSTVSVHAARGTMRGIVLPESALVPGVDTDTVFVETSPGIFTARSVRVAARFGGQVRLTAGINAGETVVIQGAMGLQGERLRSQLRHVE